MTASRRIAAMLKRRGRPMMLRRRVGTTATFTEAVMVGISRKYLPEELVGGLIQGDREIIIGTDTEAIGEPKKGDTVDGGTVQFVDVKYDVSTVIAYILTVRG